MRLILRVFFFSLALTLTSMVQASPATVQGAPPAQEQVQSQSGCRDRKSECRDSAERLQGMAWAFVLIAIVCKLTIILAPIGLGLLGVAPLLWLWGEAQYYLCALAC